MQFFIRLPEVPVSFTEGSDSPTIETRLIFDVGLLQSYLHVFLVDAEDAYAKGAVCRPKFREALCTRLDSIVATSLAAPHLIGAGSPFELSRCDITHRFRSAFRDAKDNPAFSYSLSSGICRALQTLSNHQRVALLAAAADRREALE